MVEYSCNLIQAGPWDDNNFQSYYYEDGERVPANENVGVEITIDGKTKFYLLDGIKFA